MVTFQKNSLANKPEKSTKDKQVKEKQKRLSFFAKIKNAGWRTEARKVCMERLAHYESTGNVRKADIYRRKLEG